jgi:hypothetical protein
MLIDQISMTKKINFDVKVLFLTGKVLLSYFLFSILLKK